MLSWIRKIVGFIRQAGVCGHHSLHEQKQIHLLNSILFIGMHITLLFTIIFLILGLYLFMFIDIFIMLTLVLAFALNVKRKTLLSKLIFLFLIPFELSVLPIFLKGTGMEFYHIVFLVAGFYLLNKNFQLIIFSIYLILLLVMKEYFSFSFEFFIQNWIMETFSYYPNLIICSSLIILGIVVFKNDTSRYVIISEGQNAELKLKIAELKRKDILSDKLLQELNHRVKNNLQMMSGLFTMQIYQHKNAKIAKALNDAKNRVDTISILHQHLYKGDYALKPQLKNYITELSDFILYTSGQEYDVELHVSVEDLSFKIETTTHIGLIVNELVTNAIKYGTREGFINQVLIQISSIEKGILISVSDSGPGFPTNDEIKNISSFGLDLVNDIALQYEGVVTMGDKEGANIQVEMQIA